MPGYPVTSLIFSAACAFLIHSAVTYKARIAALACLLLPLRLLLYWISNRLERRS